MIPQSNGAREYDIVPLGASLSFTCLEEPMTDAAVIEALPDSLKEFMAAGKTLFRTDDGDWEATIEYPTPAHLQKHLPQNSLIIADNGCGDSLFLAKADV